jgi:hypothetical protein
VLPIADINIPTLKTLLSSSGIISEKEVLDGQPAAQPVALPLQFSGQLGSDPDSSRRAAACWPRDGLVNSLKSITPGVWCVDAGCTLL